MGQSRPLFVYFRHFLITIPITQIEKSVVGVLGIRTRGRRMVGADETTQLWRPPYLEPLQRTLTTRQHLQLVSFYFEIFVEMPKINVFISHSTDEFKSGSVALGRCLCSQSSNPADVQGIFALIYWKRVKKLFLVM